MPVHPLSQRIADALALQPDAPAIEFDGRWFSWGQIGTAAHRIGSSLPGSDVGILLRNRPAQVAALLGVLMSGATVVTINPARGDERTRADVAGLRLSVVLGEPDDLTAVLTENPDNATISLAGIFDGPDRSMTVVGPRSGVAVRMLTSGTTGPPKRIDLSYDTLAHSVMGPDYRTAPPPAEVRRGVAVVNSPLVHIGGVYRALQCVVEARPFVLLDRFELNSWAAAVRKHRPRTVSLVPAALRTVLHSGLTRDDLAGVRTVTCGTAPLSADDADAFTAKYGIPVLTSYAATEFGGGVAGWTLADHQRYWAAKRGSVGRANTGTQLRVVDETGSVVGPDQVGRLEVRPAQHTSAQWMKTTDLARIDAEGFVWIVGRADQAIIRGGFKVMPDDVRSALETHPAVAGAAVIARADARLGETPVAVVELRTPATTEDLVSHLWKRLARYEIPTDIVVVETIPRTPSGKPDLGAIRELFRRDHAR
ncbi:AMP-dependent synthetase [Mycobacterium gordonae]|uniref:AMP-dependent synthetase n=1 Tax=Mycobacterium gordonae TaxID=1778 RepID=A0A0Q2RQ99_MYCGO|nr:MULTISPECIES: AMP-binding protein [Mycobacterium]KQH77467.1 AMP-dependent synthetase [Mycobacterium gordonae]MDP7726943.1 AMP-binding protein [Mycobacterium sp. TY813]